MLRTLVFTGPTLHPQEAGLLLPGAKVLPPVKRGDLQATAEFDPQLVAIIDGEFFQNLAVSPKEILPLLERGVRVYGAASMGALRAVELARFGMIGIGAVFRLFRSGWMMDDDEVALTYCPWTFKHTSEPLVSTRFALRRAEKRGIIQRRERHEIIQQLKNRYFPERTTAALRALAVRILGDKRDTTLVSYLIREAGDVKNEDARRLLLTLRSLAS
jgi:TfuA protein